MTFCIGSDVFGIELKYVNEIIQMQQIAPIPEVEHFIKGLINLRGKIIPVIDVADRFGKQLFEYNDRTCIIVIDVQNVVVGLIVETISEVVSIEEEDILPPPNVSKANAQAKFIRGIGKSGIMSSCCSIPSSCSVTIHLILRRSKKRTRKNK